ncbi:MAG: DUF4124 domain-containing protein [Burkholderiales bacterium]|nr:DUF4124 domain-containing protein [Burkholderiales bacterium]
MPSEVTAMPRIQPLPLLVLAVLCLAASPAPAAVATVYKCFDAKLNVVYTDQPCRGEQLEIELGAVDHAAVAELAREREAVSRAIAQRIAEGNRMPVARDYAPPAYYAGPPPGYYGNDVYYAPGWGFYGPPVADRRGDRDRPPLRKPRPPSVPASRGDLIRR